jgi:hypothetical protein
MVMPDLMKLLPIEAIQSLRRSVLYRPGNPGDMRKAQ